MDLATRKKWDRAAGAYNLMNAIGPERRWAGEKRRLYAAMDGRILFCALGTGLDVQFFPPARDITAIDISPRMLEAARPAVAAYRGRLEVLELDVHELPFADRSFDQVYTSCTFCSVPKPIEGLMELRRVLKPGGWLRMFEHTGSRFFPFNVMMHLMTPLTRPLGPDMNRDTVANVRAAGFTVRDVRNVYLDVVKIIRAVAPAVA
jgi:ubiquinone/menaquinone biosynthesis C-methylase UbiE